MAGRKTLIFSANRGKIYVTMWLSYYVYVYVYDCHAQPKLQPSLFKSGFTPHIYEVRTLKYEIKDLQTDLYKAQPPQKKKG